MFYTNPNRRIVINSEIVEHDIKSGNTSMIKTYSLLPDDKIKKLEGLSKKDRVVAVGKEMRADKEFSKNLESSFNSTVEDFLKDNDLDKNYDVLSIKRDAVFVVNRKIIKPSYGEYIHFIPKNTYHAYLYLSPYEIYFGKDDIDVKGINDSVIHKHDNGILSFLKDVISIAESGNTKELNSYLAEFVDAYKKKELEIDMYREFNNESQFRYRYASETMLCDEMDESMINGLDIGYNYINIVLPLIQLVC